MKQVTAVQWYAEQMQSKEQFTQEEFNNITNQAKEMEEQETLEHTSKFIVFTSQDSESWIQHSIPLDSFEKADNFCQQFRDRKMSYLICKTLKQGYNGK
jgi:hypothetical protein